MGFKLIAMMVIIKMIRNMASEHLFGRVAMFIRVNFSLMKEKAMEKCNGLMDLCIKVNGSKEFNMDKEK